MHFEHATLVTASGRVSEDRVGVIERDGSVVVYVADGAGGITGGAASAELARIAAAGLLLWGCGSRTELGGSIEPPDAALDVAMTHDATSITCQGAFQPPEPIASLDTDLDEYDIRFTPDELVAYFASNGARGGGATGDVFVARRASRTSPFDTPELVAGMSHPNDDAPNPNVTPDELTLIFDDGACWSCCDGPQILCTATRPSTSVSFGTPTSVSVAHAGPLQFAGGAYAVGSGLTLYFNGSHSLAVSRRAHLADPFATIDAVAVEGFDASATAPLSGPVVAEDELTMFFRGDEAFPSIGAIWEAHRDSTSVPFGNAHLVSELHTALGESPNWISPDGCRLYFTRALPTDDAGIRQLDLYVSSRAAP